MRDPARPAAIRPAPCRAAPGRLWRSLHALRELRPTALAALVALAGSAAGPAWALPGGARPVFGQAQVSQVDAQTMRIDQTSARAGIDWTSFSLAAGEMLRIVQPGAHAVLVNRVTGLDPSLILGRIQADGRVFLTNPRGVIFGAGAQVDVGGLVATSLRLGDADAQAGLWRLQPQEGAGAVRNEGRLNAGAGTIALVAPQVANSGEISARRVALGAVGEVQVDLDGDGLILLNARAADAARLDQLGTLSAAGGRAELIAAARGQVAGTVLNLRGAVRARGLSGQGGEVLIDGGSAGIVEIGAAVEASATTSTLNAGRGGDITVLGQKILLDDGARLDASGASGGGRVRVGGGFQGADANLHNAEMLTVKPGATLAADATRQGDGGQIVLWSERATRYFGQLSARGGLLGGEGGQAEVSGRYQLDFRGRADLSAPHGRNGRSGRLLLDPLDITVDDALVDTVLQGDVFFSEAPSQSPVLAAVDVSALLASTQLTLQAQRDITVASPISGANRLTLAAGNHIQVNAPISTQGLTLSANDNGGGTASGSGRVSTTAALNAGDFDLVITHNGGSGTHQLGANLSGYSLSLTGNALLTANQQWSFSGFSLPISGALSGAAQLQINGPGTLMLEGDNAGFSGGLVIAGGTVRLGGHDSAGGSGPLTVAGGAVLDVQGITLNASGVMLAPGATLANMGSEPATVAGGVTLIGNAVLDGSISPLTLAGAVGESESGAGLTSLGNVTLAANNSYTGATTVSGGTLTLAGTSLGASYLVSGGTLALGAAERLAASASLVLDSAATLQLNGDQHVAGADLRGSVTGTGTLHSAALWLSGGSYNAPIVGDTVVNLGSSLVNNTLSATHLDVSAGTLTLGAAGRLLNAPAVTVGRSASLILGGDETVGALNGTGQVSLGAATLTTRTAANASFGGTLDGSGMLVKDGSGTLTLTGASSHGGTRVLGGTLVLADGTGSAPLGTVAVLNQGTLRFERSDTLLLANTISGTGQLEMAGSGTLTLSATNSYSGGTRVSAGTLALTAPGASAGSGPITLGDTGGSLPSGSQVGNATLDLSGGATVTNALVLGSGSVVRNSAGSATLAGPLTLMGSTALRGDGSGLLVSGNITDNGAGFGLVSDGLVTVSGSNSYGGGTTVASGTLQMGLGGSSGGLGSGPVQVLGTLHLVVGDALTVTNELSGTGQILLDTPAGVSFSGASSFSGTLALRSGTLAISGAGARSGPGTLVLASGTALDVSQGGVVDATVVSQGATLGNSSGAGQLTGTVQLQAPTRLDSQGDGLLISGAVQDVGGPQALTKTGSGPVALAGANTIAGTVTVQAGTLALQRTDALAASPLVVDGGVLDIGGFDQHVSALQLLAGRLSGSTGVLSSATDADLRSGSVDLVLGGAAGVLKSGGGTVTLTADNRYGGATTVSAGTLATAAAERLPDATAVHVGSAGTLSVAGTETVGSLVLEGRLTGAGRLIAPTYELRGGTAEADLGAGALVSHGSSSLSGNAAVSSLLVADGGLLLAGPGRLSAAPAVTLPANSTLALGVDQSVGNLSGSGTVDLGSARLTVGSAADASFDGQLIGAGSLAKTGSGSFTLTAAQGYGGDTDVLAGTLRLSAANRLPPTTVLGIAAGATVEMTQTETVQGLVLAGQLSAQPAGSALFTAANVALQGGSTTVPLGAGTLTASGSNLLQVSSAASLVNVLVGTLTLGAPQLLAPNAVVRVQPGATLRLTGDQTNLTLDLMGTLSGSGTYTATGEYLLGTGSRVEVPLGRGTLNIDGNATLSQTSGATEVKVNAGTLTLASGGELASTAAVTVASTATLAVTTAQTVGTLTLEGAVAGTGTLSAERLVTTGSGAALQTTVQVAEPVVLTSGTLTIGNGGTSGALLAPSATVGGDATLAFNRSDAVSVASIAGAGTLRQAGSGTLQLQGAVADMRAVEVTAGTLALNGSGNQINDAARVNVASGGTLAVVGNSERVGSLTLQGRLAGTGATLNATSYTLTGGTTEANLGAGTLTASGGNNVIGGSAAVTAVSVTGGSLTVQNTQSLSARPGLDVQAGASITLSGSQSVGVVTNAGTLVTGTALDATRIHSTGSLRVGGQITTSGDQTYDGALGAVAGARPALTAGGDIVALNAANDFGNTVLALQARSVRLFGGGATLNLGAVSLGGDSSLSAAGRLLLGGALNLASGTLVLEGQGVPTEGMAVGSSTGAAALLPDPSNGAASGTRVLAAAAAIGQTAEGRVTTAADTLLRLRAPGGGSIVLDQAGNQFGGQVSALAGTATGSFTIPTGEATALVSQVSLRADVLRLVDDAAGPRALATAGREAGVWAAGGRQAGALAAAASSDAVRGDLVRLAAGEVSLATGTVIRARLPYSVNQGPGTSAPGLVIDLSGAGSSAAVGSAAQPLALVIDQARLGIGGLLLSVVAPPAGSAGSGLRVYLACAGCSERPAFALSAGSGAVQTFFEGQPLSGQTLSASAINNNSSLLENARRGLLEGAVRTENVTPRLRAGVIAEVGRGRPATEGGGSATRPAQCEADPGALACPAAP